MQTHEQRVETVVQKVNESNAPLSLAFENKRIEITAGPDGLTRGDVIAALVRFEYPPSFDEIERVFGRRRAGSMNE